MHLQALKLITVCGLLGFCFYVGAHPSSGIVVNSKGEVFFVHTGKGVAQIEANGTLKYIKVSRGGHWMCLDVKGAFADVQPGSYERITSVGQRPALLYADGGAPLAVCSDGKLYFASNWRGGDEHPLGGLTVSRLSPDGRLEHVSPALKAELAKLDEGVTGLAAGPDGMLYVSSPSSIFKMALDGSVTLYVGGVVVPDCSEDLPPRWPPPGFRGLDVATNGNVYAAATGCRRTVKIDSRGSISVVLKSESPWNPTGVASHAGNVYVLEWTNANNEPDKGWRPRVRKVTTGGAVTTLVEVKENLVP